VIYLTYRNTETLRVTAVNSKINRTEMHADNMHNFLTQKSCSELSKVVSLGLILTVINSYVF